MRAVFSRGALPAGARRPARTGDDRGAPRPAASAGRPPCLRRWPGCPVLVDATSLRIGGHDYRLDAPVWSPRLPPASSLDHAAEAAAHWLPELGPTLDLGPAGRRGAARRRSDGAAPRGPADVRRRRWGPRIRDSPPPGTTCWPACSWWRARLCGRSATRLADAAAVRRTRPVRTTSRARSSPAPPGAAASSPPTTCCTASPAPIAGPRSGRRWTSLRGFGSSSGRRADLRHPDRAAEPLGQLPRV